MEKLLKFPDTGRVPVRDYYLRYAVVQEVDNAGSPCTHCQTIGNDVEANIHATDTDGKPLYEESCLCCVLSLVDRFMDVDPAFTVTVEVLAL